MAGGKAQNILNTINTVKWMAILNHAPNISECLTSFGKLLEPLLKQQTDFYTVEEEISYLQNYVDTMNYSYGNTIHMTLSIPEELKKCKIPRFILQPLVENAVLHGVDKATNKVRIEIVLSTGRNILCLAVFSQGTAISPNQLPSLQRSLEDHSDAAALLPVLTFGALRFFISTVFVATKSLKTLSCSTKIIAGENSLISCSICIRE